MSVYHGLVCLDHAGEGCCALVLHTGLNGEKCTIRDNSLKDELIFLGVPALSHHFAAAACAVFYWSH